MAKRTNRLLFESGIDNFVSEAALSMPLEIRSGGHVFGVLITQYIPYFGLTNLGSAGKDLAHTAISPPNVGIKE